MTTLPLSAARPDSKLVDEAAPTHQRVEITRHGSWIRAAVLPSADDFDSPEETLEILADTALVRDIAIARKGINRGETFTLEEVETAMKARGRRFRE